MSSITIRQTWPQLVSRWVSAMACISGAHNPEPPFSQPAATTTSSRFHVACHLQFLRAKQKLLNLKHGPKNTKKNTNVSCALWEGHIMSHWQNRIHSDQFPSSWHKDNLTRMCHATNQVLRFLCQVLPGGPFSWSLATLFFSICAMPKTWDWWGMVIPPSLGIPSNGSINRHYFMIYIYIMYTMCTSRCKWMTTILKKM